MRDRRVWTVVAAIAVLCCTGCTAPHTTAPIPTATTTVTVPAPTAAGSSTPTTGTPKPVAQGCPSNGGKVPAGAGVANIEDIDGDGKADTVYWAKDAVEFGVVTASGDKIVMPDEGGLPGAGDRSGWVAPMASGPVLAVVSDGHDATLHALIDCHFVTTKGPDGKPYVFTLGAGRYGTGQECTGGAFASTRRLVGALGKDANGRRTVTLTPVTVSKDGRSATNGKPYELSGSFAPGSPQYVDAEQATCQPLALAQTPGE